MKGKFAIRTLVQTALLIGCIPALTLPALAAGFSQGMPAPGAVAAGAANAGNHILPAALRPALYRALAKDAGPAYVVNREGCVALARPKLKACFDAEGAHFTGGATPLSLHLVAYGRSGGLTPIETVRPLINGNRVSYMHGALSEWWRVLPMGFEQGFTIAKPPAGQGRLTLALTANAEATRQAGTLGWGKLRYGRLVVTDANGKVVPATLKTRGDRILIAVNDVHAAYPLTVDPLVWLDQEVTEEQGQAYDYFGWSIAISGKTALIGADWDVIKGNTQQGAAYVFTESNDTWTETQKLTASDGGAFDNFGSSVALEGTTALVGAESATLNGNYAQGAAYMFTESNGTWTQTAKLMASDGGKSEYFGFSLALSGTTAFIGEPFQYQYQDGDPAPYSQGAVYVFTESNGEWTQAQKLAASQQYDGPFGYAVATDGTTLIVGSWFNNGGAGSAYVFTNAGGTWSQSDRLAASDDTQNGQFGYSVGVDGRTAFVGAPLLGAAYVFTNSHGIWSQTQKLSPDDATQGFGVSVAMLGNTALVGANSGDAGEIGAAYLYAETHGTWAQTQKLSPPGGEPFGYGVSVALSGPTLLIGEPLNNKGVAHFYDASDLNLTVSAPQTVGQGQQYVSQTIATNNASAASPAVAVTMAVPAAASFVSATATQGSCNEAYGIVTCNFGQIGGNAGTANANVTLKATGDTGETIENTASVAQATPALTAGAATAITSGGGCPAGYSDYDGSLNPGKRAHSPIYQAPAGEENAILTGPEGFQLYAVFQNTRYGRKVYRIPGNEVHRQAPAGTYAWVVKAGDTGGTYTLCVLHP